MTLVNEFMPKLYKFIAIVTVGIIFCGIVPVRAELQNSSSTTAFSVESTSMPRLLISEPIIRVGLYKTDKPVEFISEFSYGVYAGAQLIGYLPAEEKASLEYYKGIYILKSDSLSFNSPRYLRLAPEDLSNYFTLTNCERKITGRGIFKNYRGIMEFRYSPKSKMSYVINELPLEEYIVGIAETNNGDSPEYVKALIVAARSYANAQIINVVPSEKHLFDVYANTIDQLYLGYDSEMALDTVRQASLDTFGQMVTYKTKPVSTPYFGHSDGRTRSWKKSWGGSGQPWLKSVVAKYDKGKKLWGHGVGMSCNDANMRASKDGWAYDQILKYYYSGVEIERIY